jgi:hypothetical protein
MQQNIVAMQASLHEADIAVGTAIMVFCLTLGGALFLCVGENIFQNKLVSNIVAAHINGVNASLVSAGATEIRVIVPKESLPAVLVAYNGAITQAFYVATALAALSILGSILVPWNSVKGKNIEMVAA